MRDTCYHKLTLGQQIACVKVDLFVSTHGRRLTNGIILLQTCANIQANSAKLQPAQSSLYANTESM